MAQIKLALIPAYEPGPTLLPLLRQLREAGFETLVVDDGSGPRFQDTFDAAREYAEVLSYIPNHGKGFALKKGLARLHEAYGGSGVVVTLDCDGQHSVPDAERVWQEADAHRDAVVLGARTFGKDTPARSRFGNTVTRLVYRLAAHRAVSDTQTGLRAFSLGLLPFLEQVDGDRYEYEMNVLLACARQNVPIREVPIETIYRDNNKGSHFRTLADSWLVYGYFFKFAASSFTGFLIDYGLYSLLAVSLTGLGAACVPAANVTARIVSASANFALNKRFVFKNSDSAVKTGAQYFLLAACILAGNTVLLSFLVNSLGCNKFAAKLVTEITFFTLSFLAQRFWIFRKKEQHA
jgi:putative flippase GtrA